MRAATFVLVALVSAAAFAAPAQSPVPQPAPGTPLGLVQSGRKLRQRGNFNGAIALFRQALAGDPDLYQAYLAEGETLDLQGQYGQARADLERAGQLAPGSAKPATWRALAISYAFTCDVAGAQRAEQHAFEAADNARQFYAAGEVADELARIELDCGHLAAAERWYRIGHATGLEEPGIGGARRDLWDFRLQHALARIAVRRGQTSLARQHVDRAATILAKGGNPGQKRFLPYLRGYVALYSGDPAAAMAALERADLHDPFVLALLAQAEEKAGHAAAARADYRAILRLNLHNPANAYARPLAERKLAAAG